MTTSVALMAWSAAAGSGARAELSSADDATLIDGFLRTDDEELFEILVRRYQEKVFRLAASMLGRTAESDAEDATQEVFVVVLRQLKTFRRECAFATWLYRVARNQIIDYRRRASRSPLEYGDEPLRRIADDGGFGDPQRTLSSAQSRERLLEHVDRLGETQRVVVYLHYWQGRGIAEISEMLDLRPGTVKSHLCRARQRLAASLREDGREE